MIQKREEGNPRFNVLIVGAGKQGAWSDAPGSGNEHKIISFAHAFKEHPGFELIGFVDSDYSAAQKAILTWGGCNTTIPCVFKERNVDVVVVATPDDTHYEILKQLAEYPLRLVICEKPITTDLQQAREIVELYKAKGIPLMVNYTRRFLPYYEDLKQRYEAGEFGRLLKANVFFNRGMLHTGTHAIDFYNWFVMDKDKLEHVFRIEELKGDYAYRIWQIDLFFKKHHWREERIGDMPVWQYYDKSHWYVVENAFNFLEGKELLKCTGEDGLRALEICFEVGG